MNNLRYLWAFLAFLAIWGGLSWYLAPPVRDSDVRQKVTALLTMPDAALSTEAHFIRHRSVSVLFDVFGLGPALLPYFPSDYIYAPPPYMRSKEEIR